MRSIVHVGRICSCVPTYLASCALRIFDSARKRKWKMKKRAREKKKMVDLRLKRRRKRKKGSKTMKCVFLFCGEISQRFDLWPRLPRLFERDGEQTGTLTRFRRSIRLIGSSADYCAGYFRNCVHKVSTGLMRISFINSIGSKRF